MTHAMPADLAEILAEVVPIVMQILEIVPNVALLSGSRRRVSRTGRGENLLVVELSAQFVLFVPDVVALLADVLEIIEDRLLVLGRIFRVGLHVGEILANVGLVLADLAAVALDAFPVLRCGRPVLAGTARIPRCRTYPGRCTL